MTADAKDFIDFWIQNSVHAKLEMGQAGGSQDAEELAKRLCQAAKEQGFSEDNVRAEIGDPTEYIETKLKNANLTESDRRRPKS